MKPLGAVRYAPGRRGHVESWFVKANDPSGARALWLKWTIFASAERAIAEAWAVAFRKGGPHVAAKSTVPFGDARFANDALRAEVDGAHLDLAGAHGAVGGVRFDLAFEARGAPFLHWPRAWMYERAFPSYKAVSPLADARASGAIEVEGERWAADAWPAMLGHNWGVRHADRYAWVHVNAWDDADDLVVEGFTGRARVGPLLTPFATLALARWRGETYAMNTARDLLCSRGSITNRRWSVRARGAGAELRGEAWAETDDMVGLSYANPDGPLTYCLNTKLARARFELITPAGAVVAHSRTAALEIGTHDRAHGIEMVL